MSEVSGAVLRFQLFVISYAPLALIFAIRAIPTRLHLAHLGGPKWIACWCFLFLTLLGLGLAVRLVRGAKAIGSTQLQVDSMQDEGANAAAYLATYIFPFILIGENTWQVWAAYSVYVITLAVVTLRSDLILINPTLYALGYRVLRIQFKSRGGPDASPVAEEALLISKSRVRPGQVLTVVQVAEGYMEKRVG